MPPDKVVGVETGGCPHTAIREDASMNLEAIDDLITKFPDTEIVFIESGGDNLSATFSPELADATIFVIDVSGGDKIPRKGGPGITRPDASLEVMDRDAKKMRNNRPFIFTNIRQQEGVDEIINWIKNFVLLENIQ